ncbi:MAG: SRPBCC domain-containing protein [Candidatus Sericytochromatia bacterium]
MEQKTKIKAEENKQELFIIREFDLPLDLLFKAYIEPQIVEQWMGTKVIKLENKKHGYYHFETTDPMGNKHNFSGTIHNFIPNKKIIRTFEMENTSFEAQLEFLEFESISNDKSKLTMHVIYKSVDIRNQILKLPFAHGLNMAHNKLQDIMNMFR